MFSCFHLENKGTDKSNRQRRLLRNLAPSSDRVTSTIHLDFAQNEIGTLKRYRTLSFPYHSIVMGVHNYDAASSVANADSQAVANVWLDTSLLESLDESAFSSTEFLASAPIDRDVSEVQQIEVDLYE